MGKNGWTSLTVFVIGVAILVGLYNFNQHKFVGDEYLVINNMALLWMPMLLIFLVMRREPTEFGFAIGDLKRGYRLATILFVVSLPFMFWKAHDPTFQRYYPIDPTTAVSLAHLCRFELVYGMYLFSLEFFFRGFLLFGLQKSIGWLCVFAQAVPFGIMHWGKPEFAGSFFSGIVLGILALRSKSFVPCFALHWAIAITFDVMVILAKRGVF